MEPHGQPPSPEQPWLRRPRARGTLNQPAFAEASAGYPPPHLRGFHPAGAEMGAFTPGLARGALRRRIEITGEFNSFIIAKRVSSRQGDGRRGGVGGANVGWEDQGDPSS